jgi:hypothetical protein
MRVLFNGTDHIWKFNRIGNGNTDDLTLLDNVNTAMVQQFYVKKFVMI